MRRSGGNRDVAGVVFCEPIPNGLLSHDAARNGRYLTGAAEISGRLNSEWPHNPQVVAGNPPLPPEIGTGIGPPSTRTALVPKACSRVGPIPRDADWVEQGPAPAGAPTRGPRQSRP